MCDTHTDVRFDVDHAGAVRVSGQDRDPASLECACDSADCTACRNVNVMGQVYGVAWRTIVADGM